MNKAADIINHAASLVSGDRAKQHGDMLRVHERTAAVWSAYLGIEGAPIKPYQVAFMMAQLKMIRADEGSFNLDDFVDVAGYAGCAGEIASDD